MLRALIVLGLAGCGGFESAGIAIKQVAGTVGGTLAELTLCPLGAVDCGQVFLCEAPSSNPDNDLGGVEVCIDIDEDGLFEMAEAKFGHCEPTPRHQGLCLDLCDEESPLPGGQGANAYDGSYCGEVP